MCTHTSTSTILITMFHVHLGQSVATLILCSEQESLGVIGMTVAWQIFRSGIPHGIVCGQAWRFVLSHCYIFCLFVHLSKQAADMLLCAHLRCIAWLTQWHSSLLLDYRRVLVYCTDFLVCLKMKLKYFEIIQDMYFSVYWKPARSSLLYLWLVCFCRYFVA